MEHITKNYKQTQKFGEKLGQEIIKKEQQKNAVVLCLYGDLGLGKTTFLQGFAKGLGIKQKILSPTFVILKHFKITKSGTQNPKSETNLNFQNTNFQNFYHLDCYRLQNEKDVKELGLLEILKNPENIVAIEWPERIKKILPKKCIKINFKFISQNQRVIDIMDLKR